MAKEKISNNLKFRFAEKSDVSLILKFIRQLAEYEKMPNLVTATEALLTKNLFDKKTAEVIIGECEGIPAAFALFFHNFSTFLGKPGIYLEDIFVIPEMRGRGIGKAMLSFLAKLTLERDCGRLDFSCLDWNTPAICFYEQIGAEPMDDWTIYRVHGEALHTLARSYTTML